MSKLGTEAELLARLMAQAQQAKRRSAVNEATVLGRSPGPVLTTRVDEAEPEEEDVPLAVRAARKRKAIEDVAIALPLSQTVTSTGLHVGEHVEVTTKKAKVGPSAGKVPASEKLKAIALESRLEDDGFIRRVAERLKSGGLDRMVQLQGSPRDNRAKAFDSVLRGLHNLYLIDSLEEDVTLKEQVTALEAGLQVERLEKRNVTRQRDALKAKLEKATAEGERLKVRADGLEGEASRCRALEEEGSIEITSGCRGCHIGQNGEAIWQQWN